MKHKKTLFSVLALLFAFGFSSQSKALPPKPKLLNFVKLGKIWAEVNCEDKSGYAKIDCCGHLSDKCIDRCQKLGQTGNHTQDAIDDCADGCIAAEKACGPAAPAACKTQIEDLIDLEEIRIIYKTLIDATRLEHDYKETDQKVKPSD